MEREMIIFKIINLALKDIDHHQDQITNMSNLRYKERERERDSEREREREIYTEIPTTMLLLCKYIYFFMERQREKLKTIEQQYVMYKGPLPLIKLCYRASFQNNLVERYPWSWDPEILFPIPALGSCLSQLFH